MAKSVLDDFNEEDKPKIEKSKVEVNWGKQELGMEAACAICDSLFTAPVDRPPIFCPNCKEGLKKLIVE